MLYRGPLYRALNPIYAREPLSGRGAELYGGRFNPKGVPALYSSLTVMTALREANQAGSLQPAMIQRLGECPWWLWLTISRTSKILELRRRRFPRVASARAMCA